MEIGQRERCRSCSGPLRQPARGRRRSFCSHACRQRAHRRRLGEGQQRRLVELVEADARLWLPTLPGESVDLVLTDPPYRFERSAGRFQHWFAEIADEEWPVVFAELYRILCPDRHAYVFADRRVLPLFEEAAAQAGFRVRGALVWDKVHLGLGDGWRSRYEYIGWYEKGRRPLRTRDQANVLRYPRPRGYPTEKPVPLLKHVIEQASEPGELVLDPFCGSGSCGQAARELRRRALLCDVDSEHARRRLRLASAAPEAANA